MPQFMQKKCIRHCIPNLSQSNLEDSKLYGSIYNFSVDYSAITKA